jgi:hypothetical protein
MFRTFAHFVEPVKEFIKKNLTTENSSTKVVTMYTPEGYAVKVINLGW